MIRHSSLSLRMLSLAVIGALLITGCNGSISLEGDLGLDGGEGDDGGSSITQNQLLVVLMIILLVVALVRIMR